ncbi:MAG: potassium-transporting ATPase subunit KdpC [Terriglobia bacterium]
MWRHIAPAFRMMVLLTILLGFVYPGVLTGLCHLLFPHRANGSLVRTEGRIVGSSLIGQSFAGPRYFHPRPSATGNEAYDALASGGSNLGPTSAVLYRRVKAAVANFREENPSYHGPIPADLLTASGSGLDPDISPASAFAQAARVAAARGAALRQIRRLIRQHTQRRQLGFLGEPRVNVLEINLALDRQFPPSPALPAAGIARGQGSNSSAPLARAIARALR